MDQLVQDEPDDWDHWEDTDADTDFHTSHFDNDDEEAGESAAPFPSVRMSRRMSSSIRRMSSCYFSIASEERESISDFASLWDESDSPLDSRQEKGGRGECNANAKQDWSPSSLLYHDILVNVFTYLDVPSLAAFSETARRPNFEVFYYLELNLRKALLCQPILAGDIAAERMQESRSESCSKMIGASYLSRLAQMDLGRADEIVQEYLDSNSTLKQLPLSHNLDYFRHALKQHGFPTGITDGSSLASVAFFVTLIGAAFITGASNADPETLANMNISAQAMAPNMIMGMGFLGSLMGAARTISNDGEGSEDSEQNQLRPMSMRQAAEHLARSMHRFPSNMMRQVRKNSEKPESTADAKENIPESSRATNDEENTSNLPPLGRLRCAIRSMVPLQSNDSQKHQNQNSIGLTSRPSIVLSPDPYHHKPAHNEEQAIESATLEGDAQDIPENQSNSVARKIPSGCVGAYMRSIRAAEKSISDNVKAERVTKFMELTEDEKEAKSVSFASACQSDSSLAIVKQLIDIDVDGFYSGDGGEPMNPLHTAALFGATEVVDFLCRGVDPINPENDGGACDITTTDINGWTAMHFAAGANNPSIIRVLASRGAKLDVEASNGYTPLQWAKRLSNHEALEELTKQIGNGEDRQSRWMPNQPLSTMASRFLSFMPTAAAS